MRTEASEPDREKQRRVETVLREASSVDQRLKGARTVVGRLRQRLDHLDRLTGKDRLSSLVQGPEAESRFEVMHEFIGDCARNSTEMEPELKQLHTMGTKTKQLVAAANSRPDKELSATVEHVTQEMMELVDIVASEKHVSEEVSEARRRADNLYGELRAAAAPPVDFPVQQRATGSRAVSSKSTADSYEVAEDPPFLLRGDSQRHLQQVFEEMMEEIHEHVEAGHRAAAGRAGHEAMPGAAGRARSAVQDTAALQQIIPEEFTALVLTLREELSMLVARSVQNERLIGSIVDASRDFETLRMELRHLAAHGRQRQGSDDGAEGGVAAALAAAVGGASPTPEIAMALHEEIADLVRKELSSARAEQRSQHDEWFRDVMRGTQEHHAKLKEETEDLHRELSSEIAVQHAQHHERLNDLAAEAEKINHRWREVQDDHANLRGEFLAFAKGSPRASVGFGEDQLSRRAGDALREELHRGLGEVRRELQDVRESHHRASLRGSPRDMGRDVSEALEGIDTLREEVSSLKKGGWQASGAAEEDIVAMAQDVAEEVRLHVEKEVGELLLDRVAEARQECMTEVATLREMVMELGMQVTALQPSGEGQQILHHHPHHQPHLDSSIEGVSALASLQDDSVGDGAVALAALHGEAATAASRLLEERVESLHRELRAEVMSLIDPVLSLRGISSDQAGRRDGESLREPVAVLRHRPTGGTRLDGEAGEILQQQLEGLAERFEASTKDAANMRRDVEELQHEMSRTLARGSMQRAWAAAGARNGVQLPAGFAAGGSGATGGGGTPTASSAHNFVTQEDFKAFTATIMKVITSDSSSNSQEPAPEPPDGTPGIAGSLKEAVQATVAAQQDCESLVEALTALASEHSEDASEDIVSKGDIEALQEQIEFLNCKSLRMLTKEEFEERMARLQSDHAHLEARATSSEALFAATRRESAASCDAVRNDLTHLRRQLEVHRRTSTVEVTREISPRAPLPALVEPQDSQQRLDELSSQVSALSREVKRLEHLQDSPLKHEELRSHVAELDREVKRLEHLQAGSTPPTSVGAEHQDSQRRHEELSSRVAELGVEVKRLEHLQDAHPRLQELGSHLEAVAAEVKRLEHLQDLHRKHEDLHQKHETVSSHVAELGRGVKHIEHLEGRLDKLETQGLGRSHHEEASPARARRNSEESDAPGLETLSELRGDVETVHENLDILREDIQAMQETVADLKANVEQIATDAVADGVAEALADSPSFLDLQSQVATLNKGMEEVKADSPSFLDLQSQVATLNKGMEEVKDRQGNDGSAPGALGRGSGGGEDLPGRFEEMSALVAELGRQVQRLESLQGRVDELELQSQDRDKGVDGKETVSGVQLAELKSDVEAVHENGDVLREDMQNLQESMSGLRDAVEQIAAEAVADGVAEALADSPTILDLKSQVASLSKELSDTQGQSSSTSPLPSGLDPESLEPLRAELRAEIEVLRRRLDGEASLTKTTSRSVRFAGVDEEGGSPGKQEGPAAKKELPRPSFEQLSDSVAELAEQVHGFEETVEKELPELKVLLEGHGKELPELRSLLDGHGKDLPELRAMVEVHGKDLLGLKEQVEAQASRRGPAQGASHPMLPLGGTATAGASSRPGRLTTDGLLSDATANQEEVEAYMVSVRRSPEYPNLGLNMHNMTLVVEEVKPNGMIEEWNRRCDPKQVVSPGDRILEVNGQTANIIMECTKAETLIIKFQRGRRKYEEQPGSDSTFDAMGTQMVPSSTSPGASLNRRPRAETMPCSPSQTEPSSDRPSALSGQRQRMRREKKSVSYFLEG